MDVRFKAKFRTDSAFKAKFRTEGNLSAGFGNVYEIHTDDYNDLINKPTINAVTVEGHKTGPDYRLQNKMEILSQQEIEKILYVGGN